MYVNTYMYACIYIYTYIYTYICNNIIIDVYTSRQSASAPIASWYRDRACSSSPFKKRQLPLFTSAFAL